jgi:hypothetical protein
MLAHRTYSRHRRHLSVQLTRVRRDIDVACIANDVVGLRYSCFRHSRIQLMRFVSGQVGCLATEG